MPKKLTQEQFLASVTPIHPELDFSKFEYRGREIKGVAKCNTHGEYLVRPATLLQGCGCPSCYDDRRGIHQQKMSFDAFTEAARIKHKGVYAYSTPIKWAGITTTIEITCSIHGVFKQKADKHLNGAGCRKCSCAKVQKSRQPTDQQIKDRILKIHGDKYDVSDVSYVGMAAPVTLICKKHGQFSARAGNVIHRKSGCPKCKNESVGEKSRLDQSVYFERFKKAHGDKYTYKRIFYKDSKAYVEIECAMHGAFVQLIMDHQKGIGCLKCGIDYWDRPSFVEAARKIHGERYDYSEVTYTGANSPVRILCKKHGMFEQRPGSHVASGQGCPTCGRCGPSKTHIEMKEFLEQHTEVVIEHRLNWSNRRLDIFLPKHNLAVEFHGLIWHSEKFAKDIYNLKNKHDESHICGIRVIHIFEDEWVYRKEAVRSLLMTAIGVEKAVCYARQCSINQVTSEEAVAFLNLNHVQGHVKGCVHYGAYFNNKLVALMSFSKAKSHRGLKGSTEIWELRRFASSCRVPGIASRLFTHFKREMQPITVISYSDSRLFTGKMYERLGFTKDWETLPDYYYVSNSSDKRYHKRNFAHSNLKTKFGDKYDQSKTEVENCNANGWYRIFDCGKVRWRWETKNPA